MVTVVRPRKKTVVALRGNVDNRWMQEAGNFTSWMRTYGASFGMVCAAIERFEPLRTISYGIPILVIGVLAALPFRRVPDEPLPGAEVQTPAVTSPTALVEIDSHVNAVWTPPPVAVAPPRVAPPSLPPLPDDYEHVAVPLATPPAIAQRYAAVQQTEQLGVNPSLAEHSAADPWAAHRPRDPAQDVAAFQYQLPPQPGPDRQAATGWETDLPLASGAVPAAPSTTDRQDAQPAVAALKASFPRSAASPSAAQAEPTVEFSRPAPPPAVSSAPPRKRYYIREPVGL